MSLVNTLELHSDLNVVQDSISLELHENSMYCPEEYVSEAHVYELPVDMLT